MFERGCNNGTIMQEEVHKVVRCRTKVSCRVME